MNVIVVLYNFKLEFLICKFENFVWLYFLFKKKIWWFVYLLLEYEIVWDLNVGKRIFM